MSPSDAMTQAAVATAGSWYESKRHKTGHVNFNIMAVGIAVSHFLATEAFPLDEAAITASNGAQVKGLNAKFISKRLTAYGIVGRIPAEGGRTSRGSLTNALELSRALNEALLPWEPSYLSRIAASEALERYFVRCIEEDYFNRQRIDVALDASKPMSAMIADIIAASHQREDIPTGTVTQHLVGAKLELRFPGADIGRDQANAADQQTNRQGDFQLGATAFHVTISPMTKLIDRARANIRDGFRPVVLVPEGKVMFARGLFQSEPDLLDRVGVQSIETFIGTNLEEMAKFDIDVLHRIIALFIRTYNERIEEAETDLSLRIVEPQWIKDLLDP